MGFLDKATAKLQEATKATQVKLDDVSAKRGSDKLLRDLGAWYYASRTERGGANADAEVERLIGELQAHEAEHGPLGGDREDDPAAAAAAAAPMAPPPPPDAGVAAPPPTPPPPTPPSPPPTPPSPAPAPPTSTMPAADLPTESFPPSAPPAPPAG
jgi:hypothetical protein